MPPVVHSGLSEEILVQATRIVHIGPCILHSLLLAADGANEDVQLFDGTNANAEERFHLEALSGTTFGWSSVNGILLHKGIYVVVKDANAHLMVEYHPIKLGAVGKIIKEV